MTLPILFAIGVVGALCQGFTLWEAISPWVALWIVGQFSR